MLGDRFYNNIFIDPPLETFNGGAYPDFSQFTTWNPVYPYTDMIANYNVYYHGARKAIFEGTASVVDNAFATNLMVTDLANGVKIDFNMNSSGTGIQCPLVDNNLITKYPVINVGIEDHDGNPITVDRDMLGNVRNTTHPKIGPLEGLASGANSITRTAGPYTPLSTPTMQPKSMQQKNGSVKSGTGTSAVYDLRGRLVVRNVHATKGVGPALHSQGAYIVVRNVDKQKVVEKTIVSR